MSFNISEGSRSNKNPIPHKDSDEHQHRKRFSSGSGVEASSLKENDFSHRLYSPPQYSTNTRSREHQYPQDHFRGLPSRFEPYNKSRDDDHRQLRERKYDDYRDDHKHDVRRVSSYNDKVYGSGVLNKQGILKNGVIPNFKNLLHAKSFFYGLRFGNLSNEINVVELFNKSTEKLVSFLDGSKYIKDKNLEILMKSYYVAFGAVLDVSLVNGEKLIIDKVVLRLAVCYCLKNQDNFLFGKMFYKSLLLIEGFSKEIMDIALSFYVDLNNDKDWVKFHSLLVMYYKVSEYIDCSSIKNTIENEMLILINSKSSLLKLNPLKIFQIYKSFNRNENYINYLRSSVVGEVVGQKKLNLDQKAIMVLILISIDNGSNAFLIKEFESLLSCYVGIVKQNKTSKYFLTELFIAILKVENLPSNVLDIIFNQMCDSFDYLKNYNGVENQVFNERIFEIVLNLIKYKKSQNDLTFIKYFKFEGEKILDVII